MTRFLSLGAFLLLLTGCSGSSSTGGSDDFSRGTNAINDYRFNESDSLLSSLEKEDSISARAAYLVGLSKERQLLLWDAMEHYLRATTRDQGYAPAFGGLARVYSALGSEVVAADVGRRFAELSKSDPEAWAMYASLLISAGQLPEANRALGQAEAAGYPSDASSLIKARLAFARHDISAADAASAVAVNSPSAKRALADYLEDRGFADSAIAISRAIFEDDRSHVAMIEHFFRSLRVGYLTEARQMIRDMEKRDKTTILPRAAWALYYDGAQDWANGLTAVYQLQEVRPAALSTVAYLYDIAARSVNLTVAGSASEELMANVEALRMHPMTKQYAIYRRISPRVRLMLPPVAVVSLDSVKVAAIRGELEYQAWYAFALEQWQKVDDTLPSFSSFVEPWGNDPAHWTAFASTRLGFNPIKAITAESLLTTVLTDHPNFRPAFDSLSEMYLFVADFAKAAALFEQYPHYAQIYPDEAIRQGIALAEAGRGDDAVTAALRGLDQSAGKSMLLDRLARALARRGFSTQARRVVEKALTYRADDPDLLAIAARLACDLAECDKALELIETGLDKEPTHKALRAEKGRALFDSGSEEEGLKLLDDIVMNEGGNGDALLYLSHRLAKLNKDPNKAQDLARQAILACPLYKRANINLAQVYLMTGRPELARGAAKTALSQFQHDAEAYFLLGKALATENDPEAKEVLQLAKRHGLAGDPLKEAEALLQRM
ncbi:MAG: hypothetical protein NDJ18_10630 [candidate division Zixibacteria bacterium]|nr:hypothetical protein [candidate division Zixibacteria bacterium]